MKTKKVKEVKVTFAALVEWCINVDNELYVKELECAWRRTNLKGEKDL